MLNSILHVLYNPNIRELKGPAKSVPYNRIPLHPVKREFPLPIFVKKFICKEKLFYSNFSKQFLIVAVVIFSHDLKSHIIDWSMSGFLMSHIMLGDLEIWSQVSSVNNLRKCIFKLAIMPWSMGWIREVTFGGRNFTEIYFKGGIFLWLEFYPTWVTNSPICFSTFYCDHSQPEESLCFWMLEVS